jgi:hypothetical protein
MPEIAWTMYGGRKKNNVTEVVLANNTPKTISLSPGTAKRWLLLKGRMANPDNVARNCSVVHLISTNYLASIVSNNSIGATFSQVFPSPAHNGNTEVGGVGTLFIVEGSETVDFADNRRRSKRTTTKPRI